MGKDWSTRRTEVYYFNDASPGEIVLEENLLLGKESGKLFQDAVIKEVQFFGSLKDLKRTVEQLKELSEQYFSDFAVSQIKSEIAEEDYVANFLMQMFSFLSVKSSYQHKIISDYFSTEELWWKFLGEFRIEQSLKPKRQFILSYLKANDEIRVTPVEIVKVEYANFVADTPTGRKEFKRNKITSLTAIGGIFGSGDFPLYPVLSLRFEFARVFGKLNLDLTVTKE